MSVKNELNLFAVCCLSVNVCLFSLNKSGFVLCVEYHLLFAMFSLASFLCFKKSFIVHMCLITLILCFKIPLYVVMLVCKTKNSEIFGFVILRCLYNLSIFYID